MAYLSVNTPTRLPLHTLPVHALHMTGVFCNASGAVAEARELVMCPWRPVLDGGQQGGGVGLLWFVTLKKRPWFLRVANLSFNINEVGP
jgi:hypothetical protein